MMGGGLGWWLIASALVVIPFWRLLPRYGIPSWVALFTAITPVAIVLLWIMAFRDDGSAGPRG